MFGEINVLPRSESAQKTCSLLLQIFRMNFFIRNLAAADLCVGLISVLTDIIWKITISWEAGDVACK